MAIKYLAAIPESDFAEFARVVPKLLTPHAAYAEQVGRREAEWLRTPGNTVELVLVTADDLKAYVARGRALNLSALSVLAFEKGEAQSHMEPYGGTYPESEGTIVRVTIREGWVRPVSALWIAATPDPQAAVAAVRDRAQADWTIEAFGPSPAGFVARYGLQPGQACPFPPPR
ncbi:hypothetical protein [Reyranella sp.]|uniref:hypothetical protein n=1 Tax=Reyranella sp. TaxID=1929291 RepID=UPI0037840205